MEARLRTGRTLNDSGIDSSRFTLSLQNERFLFGPAFRLVFPVACLAASPQLNHGCALHDSKQRISVDRSEGNAVRVLATPLESAPQKHTRDTSHTSSEAAPAPFVSGSRRFACSVQARALTFCTSAHSSCARFSRRAENPENARIGVRTRTRVVRCWAAVSWQRLAGAPALFIPAFPHSAGRRL